MSDFIRQHKEDDVRSLAFQKMPEGVDRIWALRQIEGYQLAKKKLPQWAALFKQGKDIHFPPRLSMEQCSSEATAKYKENIIKDFYTTSGTFVDLTGGYGVDFSYMARSFGRAIYVEQNKELCDIARHNFPLLDLPQAEVVNATSEDFLSGINSDYDFRSPVIFLDPARRDASGSKVFCIEDCTPDLTLLQDTLLNIADTIIVKLSPMLDITQALRTLRNVTDVHVVSVRGECKEILFVLRTSTVLNHQQCSVTYHCINLETEEDEFHYSLPSSILKKGERSALAVGDFLFEPNVSILKAGLQDAFGKHYGLQKLHPNSNLYIGTHPIVHVPARQFRIVDVTDFGKENLKTFLQRLKTSDGTLQANLTVRNFPSDVANLRKRLKIKEGGSEYLFATTLYAGSHALIRCVKCSV